MGGAASRWVEDFSPGALKPIGALEFLAAVGLIVPAALGIAPVLVPLAGHPRALWPPASAWKWTGWSTASAASPCSTG